MKVMKEVGNCGLCRSAVSKDTFVENKYIVNNLKTDIRENLNLNYLGLGKWRPVWVFFFSWESKVQIRSVLNFFFTGLNHQKKLSTQTL